ncbi:MAG: hypothetical protein CL526_08915 [Aequorivita sp.]|nr:hypothetical protein [Aequorivita sp.]|tara:strand:- start:93011 stop:93505 length:495 start_codon:yes stop_codon:yes gene_type:complete
MKKLLLFVAVVVLSFTTAQSQSLNLGVSAALPVGDSADGYTFGAQADFSYLFEINESFHVGPMASLLYYNGDEMDIPGVGTFEVDSALFLPIGGSARFLLEEFFFGADLGYGIGLSPDGNDGGFFYRPKVGYDFGSLAAILSYSGVSMDGGTFSSVNIGVEFGL